MEGKLAKLLYLKAEEVVGKKNNTTNLYFIFLDVVFFSILAVLFTLG